MNHTWRKVREGRVVSDKMEKTIVVRVERKYRSRLYKKLVRRHSRLMVHDEHNEARVGDFVRVIETRPLSRTKRWRLLEIVHRDESLRSGREESVGNREAQLESDRDDQSQHDSSEIDHRTREAQIARRPTVDGEEEHEQPNPTDVIQPESDETASAEPETPEGVQPNGTGIEATEERRVGESHLGRDANGSGPQEMQTSDRRPNGTPRPGTRRPESPSDKTVSSFADHIIECMTPDPTFERDRPVSLPEGGPSTDESVERDTSVWSESGRRGAHEVREIRRYVLSKEARKISQQVRDLLEGDYGGRCQICGSTFVTPSGNVQVFTDHIVDPQKDSRTNHFGNLLSLCGWHYALVSYGQWVFRDRATGSPTATGINLHSLVGTVAEEIDDDGNRFVPVPIRFWNVYRCWRSEPECIDAEIRFSIPHWKYFRRLIRA